MIEQSEIKEWYNHEYAENPRRFTRDLKHYQPFLNCLSPQAGKKILDVSCGTGGFLSLAGKMGLRVCGVDLANKAIEAAKKILPGAELKVANGEALPFPDQEFDYVTNIGSLEHYLNPGQGIKEMRRVLKKGGKILIVLPNSFWEMHKGTGQRVEKLNTLRAWTRLLKENGLKVLKINKDYGPGIFHDHKAHKIIFRAIGKVITLILPVSFAYQFVFLCEAGGKQ